MLMKMKTTYSNTSLTNFVLSAGVTRDVGKLGCESMERTEKSASVIIERVKSVKFGQRNVFLMLIVSEILNLGE